MDISQVNTTEKVKETTPTKVSRLNLRYGLSSTFVTLLAIAILVIFLAPFAFMVFTSLKT